MARYKGFKKVYDKKHGKTRVRAYNNSSAGIGIIEMHTKRKDQDDQEFREIVDTSFRYGAKYIEQWLYELLKTRLSVQLLVIINDDGKLTLVEK